MRKVILTRLSIKSMIRFKSVSKLWYSTLSSSHSAFAHLKFPKPSPIECLLIRNDYKFQIMSYKNDEIDLVNMEADFDVGDEKMDLVGTWNGLVCLGSHSGRLSIVWNPITREFQKYLVTEISNSFGPDGLVFWGFGYVCSDDDYKIVRLCMDISGHSLTVHVCSIRLDTWRVTNNDAYDTSNLSYPALIRTSGLFLNGTLYWGLSEVICSFNLESEKLNTFPELEVMTSSTSLSYVNTFDNRLFVVNGCLSMYGPCRIGNDHIFTILKSPEVVQQIINPKDVAGLMPYGGVLIGFTRSNKIFIQSSKQRLGFIDLSLRPLNLAPLMKLGGRGVTEVVSYTPTLISLKSMCYKND